MKFLLFFYKDINEILLQLSPIWSVEFGRQHKHKNGINTVSMTSY